MSNSILECNIKDKNRQVNSINYTKLSSYPLDYFFTFLKTVILMIQQVTSINFQSVYLKIFFI